MNNCISDFMMPIFFQKKRPCVRAKTSLRLKENVKEFWTKRKGVLPETQGRFV